MALLEVQDIQVYYGMIQALKGVSFSVNEGEVIGQNQDILFMTDRISQRFRLTRS